MWVKAVSTWDLPQQNQLSAEGLFAWHVFNFIDCHPDAGNILGQERSQMLRFSLKARPLRVSWLTEPAAQHACAKPCNPLTLALLSPSLLRGQAVPAVTYQNTAHRIGPAIWCFRAREKEQQLPWANISQLLSAPVSSSLPVCLPPDGNAWLLHVDLPLKTPWTISAWLCSRHKLYL